MNHLDISEVMRLSPEDIAQFVENTNKKIKEDGVEKFFNLLASLNFSNKHIFLEAPREQLVRYVIMSLLYSAADPFTAQTHVMESHVKVLKEVCDKLDMAYDCLVPISTVEDKIMAAL